jgi:putative oxidoreductase
MKTLNRNTDIGLLILRLSLGVLMILHGISKLVYGPGFIENIVLSSGLPSFVAYGVYVGEVIAPIFIILGYGTRIAAAIFAFNMLVAVGLVHASGIFSLNETGGWILELQGLYFFGALVLVFTGGGKYALSNKHFWD